MRVGVLIVVMILLGGCTLSAGETADESIFLASIEMGPSGGRWEIIGEFDNLRWFRLEIPPGALEEHVTIELWIVPGTEDRPKDFFPVSPIVEIRASDINLKNDVVVLLPYEDSDQDGVIDGTPFPESRLFPAYHDAVNNCWGPLASLVPDHGANVAAFYTDHFGTFGLWSTAPDPHQSEVDVKSMFLIWIDWLNDPSLTEAEAVRKLHLEGINQVYLHVYSPDELHPGQGILECSSDSNQLPPGTDTRDLFSLQEFLVQADAVGMDVVLGITCFSHAPPHNQAQRQHLKEVADYFLREYPAAGGVMLDFIRYTGEEYEVTPSPENIVQVTSFVRELKESHLQGLPLYLCLWGHANTYREQFLGQRYADLTALADVFCPMLYDTGPGATERIIENLRKNLLCRSVANGLEVIPILTTYDPITPLEMGEQIEACTQERVTGVGFFSFNWTDDAEWEVIQSRLRLE